MQPASVSSETSRRGRGGQAWGPASSIGGLIGLFAILAPLLILWSAAAEHNVALPVYGNQGIGLGFIAAGLALFLARVNPDVLPHSKYVAGTIVCLGASMWAQSAAGLWLVTPAVALGCVSWVISEERALNFLPADEDEPPTTYERVRFLTCTLLPWISFYYFTIHLRLPGRAFAFDFEHGLPIFAWTTFAYQSTYLAVALAPWCARTRRDLRRLTISSWAATICVFTFYWVVPSTAPRRPLDTSNWMARMLSAERNVYPPTAAFPSFHVLWAIFIGRLYRPRYLGVLYVAVIGVTCISTGMHYIPDVLASLVIFPLFVWPDRIGRGFLRVTRALANSRREWLVGAAALVHMAIVTSAVGPGQAWQVFATCIAGLAGARLWGFHGAAIGTAAACIALDNSWMLLGAHCLTAPWTLAIAHLAGERPAASFAANVVLGSLLSKLWVSGTSMGMEAGACLLGLGFSRFPQTSGSKRWMEVGLVAAGAACTTMVAPAAPAFRWSWEALIPSLLFTVISAGVMRRAGTLAGR